MYNRITNSIYSMLLRILMRLVLSFILVFTAVPPTLAVGNSGSTPMGDLPLEAGVYAVPGRPHLRLKVLVYHAQPVIKPGKPGPVVPTEVCHLADLDSSSVTPLGGWKLPTNWQYHLNAASAPFSLTSSEVTELTTKAFDAWNTAANGKVAITGGGSTTKNKAVRDNDSIVAWGRTSGTALATTYIWYDTTTSPYTVQEIDMIMNQKFAWEWSNPSSWGTKTESGTTCAYEGVYDAENIMTHEVGHWFGMDDTYATAYTENTMYGYGAKTETKKNSLTTGDRQALNTLY